MSTERDPKYWDGKTQEALAQSQACDPITEARFRDVLRELAEGYRRMAARLWAEEERKQKASEPFDFVIVRYWVALNLSIPIPVSEARSKKIYGVIDSSG
jgi:hypothetical protein